MAKRNKITKDDIEILLACRANLGAALAELIAWYGEESAGDYVNRLVRARKVCEKYAHERLMQEMKRVDESHL